MSLVLRYRQGTRVDIEANPFENLATLLSRREDVTQFPFGILDELIHENVWDQWPRADADSTWFALLREYFKIYEDSARAAALPAQLRILEALAVPGSPQDIWSRVQDALARDLDDLTGWNLSFARSNALRWQAQRAEDGRYYFDDAGERTEVIGVRTIAETKLEFTVDDCTRKYGNVGRICRFVALFCAWRDFEKEPQRYPESIRITLPEDSFLHWTWYHLSPIGSRVVPWRPPDRHSDPETIAIDLAARYTELNPLPLPTAQPPHAVPNEDFPRQYEVAIDTDLRIGDDAEVLLQYAEREVRWINGTRMLCPVVIVGVRDDDSLEDRQFVSELLSVICFETRLPMVPAMSIIGPRRQAPMVRQPRKLADHLYPADLHFRIGRDLSPERRLALALYRDGVSSRSPYYQFLSLYKVLQIRLPGATVAGWINDHVDDNVPSVTRVKELRAQGVTNVAAYLYETWRNAIAHVEREPRVNPDDLETRTRMFRDLPIVHDLARAMITSDLLD